MEKKTLANFFLGVIGLLILLSLYFRFIGPIPFSVSSIVTNKTDLFTVTGEGKATAVPNMAQINLGISVTKPTVKEAQNEANTIINRISSELKKLGIEEKDIQTINYSVNPTYDFSTSRQRVTGYQVSANLEVKVRDFDKINQVIDIATASGANQIGSLQFLLDDEKLKEVQNKAREEAAKAAKEKAQSLANAAGISLGKIVNIQETTTPTIQPLRAGAMEKTIDTIEPTQIEPGETEIRIMVSLSYEIR